MACSVSKNSSSTASLRVKQTQKGFQRFCKMELTLLLTKIQTFIKIKEKL